MSIHIPHISVFNGTDPTRTLTIRNKFVAQMQRRFKLLMADVYEAIVDLDVLGLENTPRLTINASGLSPKQFDFPTNTQKIEAFVKWFNKQTELYLLSGGREGLSSAALSKARQSWMNTYLDSAYQQGIRRARQELRKKGIDIDDGTLRSLLGDPITVAFNAPMNADRIGMIYSRVYSSLKGITAEMDSVVSDVLALGIADGRGPREIARLLEKALTGKGTGDDLAILDSLGRKIPAKRRAEILARTEVIRAHHSANIAEYRAAGILGIEIMVEVLHAGDDRVCEICLRKFPPKNRYTLDEAENLIPVHPQ